MVPRYFGRYEIKAELARGGMGSVYHAYDPRFQRDVALKILPREMQHREEFRKRFAREAVAVAQLEHPAIVPVHDYGEEHEQAYLVMRLMRGGSLAQRMHEWPMTPEEAARVLRPIASALDFAHSKGIVHRDIKPGNILFDESGRPYLTDFGIVKLLEGESQALTATGGVLGTPAYMSPEQVQGGYVDGRSDVYSLGAVYYVMLTGKQPYESDTPMGLALKHVLEPVPDIRAASAALPRQAQEVIARAMAKRPQDRYQTAGALADAATALATTGHVGPTAASATAGLSEMGTRATVLMPDESLAGETVQKTSSAPGPAEAVKGPAKPAGRSFARLAPLVGAAAVVIVLLMCACGAIASWQLGWLNSDSGTSATDEAGVAGGLGEQASSEAMLPDATAADATPFDKGAPATGGGLDETAALTLTPATIAPAVAGTGTATIASTAASSSAPTSAPTALPATSATGTPTPAPTSAAGPVTYAVTVATSCEFLSGTNANVFVKLYGPNGDSGAVLLDRADLDDFEACETNTYQVSVNADLGELSQLEIWHDNSGLLAGWRLDWVNVKNGTTGKEWSFPCSRWLATDNEDGATFRRIVPGGPCQ